jgi:hypothetical protein
MQIGGNVTKDGDPLVVVEDSIIRRKPPCEKHTNAPWKKHRHTPLLYNDPTA